MNKWYTIVLLAVICGCSSSKSGILDDIEIIPVDVDNTSPDASSFIEKIEIVPLETTDSSIIGGYRKTMYNKCMDMYAIYGKNQIISTFSGDGSFIANSKHMRGKGPKEYYMVTNMSFNPYMKGIDLLNPYGTIYTYSPTFELISKRDINAEFFLDASMPLNSDDYIFTIPAIWTNQEAYFINLETQNQDITNYSGTISSGNTMDKECFYKIGNNFYFVPRGINYYFYRIDDKKKVLIPIMYLDFGDSEIREGDLPGCAVGENTGTNRTKSDNKRDKLLKGMQERAQFIRDECLVAPLVKFFNDDYVYIFFTRGVQGYGGHYIYNRKNGEGFLLNEGKPFVMQPCFGIEGNVLMAITDAYYLPTVVDTSLMSAQEIHKMGQLKEEDNPVILKYYLRK